MFSIERKGNEIGLELLSLFSGLDHYERLYVHQVTELTNSGAPFIILLLEKHQVLTKSLRSTMRYQAEVEEVEPVLLFSLAHDLGRVMIQKETLGVKIADFFLKQDINFKEYPQFSHNYLVTGDNPDGVKEHMPPTLMKALSIHQGLTVEINQKVGLVRTEKNLSEDVLLQLISIGNQVSD